MNKPSRLSMIPSTLLCCLFASIVNAGAGDGAAGVGSASPSAAGAPPAAAIAADEPALPARFETPDAAAMALIEATGEAGSDGLFGVLGDDLLELVSGDPVADAADRAAFVELAAQGMQIEDETEDSAILVLGPEDWPFPIPLARDAGGWYFDTAAGIEEVLDRRIGENELRAIATARAFVDAQMEYAAADPDGNGVHDYAARLWSGPGRKDGLYWPTASGEPESPMGPLVADAVDEGYAVRAEGEGPRPYHGYYFRVLKTPTANGFGLLAWPASYGKSGIMSFQVNQRGVVYERDLGEDTAMVVAAITSYDPSGDWEPVVD